MIITVTLNPALDQTVWVERLQRGAVNRPVASQLDPAGKGINASRIIHRLGHRALALGFLAGHVGDLLRDALDAEGVPSHFLRLPGETRIDVTIVDAAGDATSLYGPGPAIEVAELAKLDELIACWLDVAEILVLAGSLPPGVPDDYYARWIERARRRGVRTILDTGGAALRRGIGALPEVVKPNLSEAAALLGRPIKDEPDVIRAALELRDRGVETVIISQGAKGAICASADGAWKAIPPAIDRRSTVGSGDSMVGALAVALARGDGVLAGLRLGSAAGAATAASRGTTLGSAALIAQLLRDVRIESLSDRSFESPIVGSGP